jgi:hypothetical protein
MEAQPLVRNAANKKQVKSAKATAKFVREGELKDISAMLGTVEGRRVAWRILTKCRVFESIWHGSAMIHYNSGQQDLGHWLMSEITDADEALLFKMMKENKGE